MSPTILSSTSISLAKAGPSWSSAFFSWQSAVMFTVVVTLAIVQPWKLLRAGVPVTAESAAELPRSVVVAQPEPAKSSGVVLPATIRPWQVTSLNARANGYVLRWHFDLGSKVKAGQLLAEIETPELDQQVTEAEALASEAAAAATQARAELAEAEADLQVARSQHKRSETEAELTKLQAARRKNLLAQNAVSVEEFEVFEKQVDSRAAEVAAAAADVARRQTSLQTRKAVIAAREAAAKSRQANVERLKELQDFKRIVAPFDGVVTARTVEVGMLVTAGAESLFVIEDMSRVRVQVNVPQAYSAQIHTGTAATVSVPEASAVSVNVAVTRIAQSVNVASRTMVAEIELPNADNRFQPGSYAQVTLAATADAKSWTVPSNTLQMQVEGPHVAVVDDHGQVELRRVVLGRDLGNRVVVVDGIRGTEQLVVNPGDALRSGTLVRVSNPLASRTNEPSQTDMAGE